jgi:nucleoid-associated protein YgaU
LTVELLQKQAAAVGVAVQNLALELNDGTATVRGSVGSQSEREKLLLAIGNTPGIGQVDDQLTVSAPATTASATLYTVKRGDTLSAIAKSYYKDGSKYTRIFEANRPMLGDPNKIYPGQVLRIPPEA